MKGVYIGAGSDIVYLNIDFTEFVLIDSLPKSENGTTVDTNGYRHEFLPEVITNHEKSGFILVDHTDHLHFQKGNQDVYYYYSVAFPEEVTPELALKLKDFDLIYYSGFGPNKAIMDYAKAKIKFYGSINTIYIDDRDEIDKNDLGWYLYDNPNRVSKWRCVYNKWDKGNGCKQYIRTVAISSFDSLVDKVDEWNEKRHRKMWRGIKHREFYLWYHK